MSPAGPPAASALAIRRASSCRRGATEWSARRPALPAGALDRRRNRPRARARRAASIRALTGSIRALLLAQAIDVWALALRFNRFGPASSARSRVRPLFPSPRSVVANDDDRACKTTPRSRPLFPAAREAMSVPAPSRRDAEARRAERKQKAKRRRRRAQSAAGNNRVSPGVLSTLQSQNQKECRKWMSIVSKGTGSRSRAR